MPTLTLPSGKKLFSVVKSLPRGLWVIVLSFSPIHDELDVDEDNMVVDKHGHRILFLLFKNSKTLLTT